MPADQWLQLVSPLDESALLDSRSVSAGTFLVELPPMLGDVVSRAYATADSFFSLEESKKRAFDARTNRTVRGWTKTESTAADIKAEHHRDYEAFDVALPRASDLSDTVASRLFDQANAWPSEEFRISSESLTRDVCAPLERYVWSLLGRSVELDTNYLAQSSASDGLRYLRYLTYPPMPTTSTTVGFYPHKDFEAFTIHLEDAPGMEVWNPETERWIQVRHGGQHCLVLIGQLGELLSSGKLKSALHRVRIQSPSKHRRHSIAYFTAPSFDAPIPECGVGNENVVTTVGDYLTRRFMKSFGLTH